MATTKAIIDVSINTSDAAAQLRNLQTQINSFNAALNKNNVAQSLASKQLAEQLMAAANATTAFTAEQVRMETAARRLDQTLMKGRATLGQYFSARFKKDSSEAAAVLSLANARAQALETQFIKTAGAANGFRDAIAIRPLQALNDSMLVANQRAAIHSAMLRQATTSMINFGKNTQWAGRQLMVGFTVPLTIFGAAAGKTFKEIEQAAVRFKKVYGDAFTTPEELEANMKAVEGLALEFTKYGIAVKDTIGLAAEAAAAGAQNAELIAATTEATRLATLGQMEQQEALSATIALQNAFKLSAKDLATEVNFLNAVENQTVVTLQDLAGAIPRVAPVIVGLGGDVRDMAAMLAAMQEGGVSAAQGANALKSGLGSLINPTNKATESLAKMGINLNQIVQANRGDLMGTVQAFGKALATLDEFSRQQALEEVFGKYQYARLGALFDNIIKDGTQASRVMQLAGMSAEQMAKGAEKELAFISEATSTKYMAAMERFKLAIAPIGEMFMKISTPIINFFAKLFEMFDKLPEGAKTFSAFAAIIVGVVVPAGTMFLGLLMNLIGTLTKFGHIIGVAVKGLGKGGIGGAVQAVSQAMRYMGIQEIEASNAATQLGLSTEFANKALLDQVTRAGSAQAAIDNLKDAYIRLITVQSQMAEMSGGILAPSAAAAGAAAAKPVKPRVRRAFGGTIPGSGNSDTVPAMLTPGEFVVNKTATSNNLPLLQAINNSGKVPGFNNGGLMSVDQYMSAEKQFLAALGGTTAKQSTLLGLGLPTGTRELSQLSEREMAQFNQMVSGALKSRGIESDLITLLGMGIVPGGRDINDLLRRGKLPGHMAAAFFGNPDIWMPMTQTAAGLYLPSAASNFTKTIAPQIASALKTMKNVADDDVYAVVERVMRESGGSRFYEQLQKDPGAVRFGLTTMLSQQLASTNPRGSREVYTPVLSSVGSGVRSVDYKGRSGVFGTFGDLGPLVFGPGLTSDIPGRQSYQRQYDFPGQQKIHIARGIRPRMMANGGLVSVLRSIGQLSQLRGTGLLGGMRNTSTRSGSTNRYARPSAGAPSPVKRIKDAIFGSGGLKNFGMQEDDLLRSIGTIGGMNDNEIDHLLKSSKIRNIASAHIQKDVDPKTGQKLWKSANIRFASGLENNFLNDIFGGWLRSSNISVSGGRGYGGLLKSTAPDEEISQLLLGGKHPTTSAEYRILEQWMTNILSSDEFGNLSKSNKVRIKSLLAIAKIRNNTASIPRLKDEQNIFTGDVKTLEDIIKQSGMAYGGIVQSKKNFYGRFNAKTVELFTKWISSQPSAIASMKTDVSKNAELAQMFRSGFRKSAKAETLERATWLAKASLPQPGDTMSLGALASFSPKGRGVLQHLADSKLQKDAENASYWLGVDQRLQKQDAKRLRDIAEKGKENWPSWAPESRFFDPGTRETGIDAYIKNTTGWIESRKSSIKKHKEQIRQYKQMIPTIIELETPKGTIRANIDDIVELQNQQFMGKSTSEQERILHNALIQVLDINEEDQGVRRIRAKLLSSELPGFNTGGFISPTLRANRGNIVPGTGNTDTVPAMLTPGEFVINKQATTDNLPLLHAINSGKIAGYKEGGRVESIDDDLFVARGGGDQELGIYETREEAENRVKEYRKEIRDRAKRARGRRPAMAGGGMRGMVMGSALGMAGMMGGGTAGGMIGGDAGAMVGSIAGGMLPMLLPKAMGGMMGGGAAGGAGIGAGVAALASNPVGWVIGGVAAAAALASTGLILWRKGIDDASKKTAEMGANLGVTSNSLNTMAKMLGTTTPIQRKMQMDLAFTQEEIAKSQEIAPVLQSEQGQKFVEDLKNATSEERFKKLSDYLRTAIASGMMDVSTAQAFGKNVAMATGDIGLGTKIAPTLFSQKRGTGGMLGIANERLAAVSANEAVKRVMAAGPGSKTITTNDAGTAVGSAIQVIQDFSNVAALAREEYNAGKISLSEFNNAIKQSTDAQSTYSEVLRKSVVGSMEQGGTRQAILDQLTLAGLNPEQLDVMANAQNIGIGSILGSPTAFAQQFAKQQMDEKGLKLPAIPPRVMNAAYAELLKTQEASLAEGERRGAIIKEAQDAGMQEVMMAAVAANEITVEQYMAISKEVQNGTDAGIAYIESWMKNGKDLAAVTKASFAAATKEVGVAGLTNLNQTRNRMGVAQEGNLDKYIRIGTEFSTAGGSLPQYQAFIENLPTTKRVDVLTEFDGMTPNQMVEFFKNYDNLTQTIGQRNATLLQSSKLYIDQFKAGNAAMFTQQAELAGKKGVGEVYGGIIADITTNDNGKSTMTSDEWLDRSEKVIKALDDYKKGDKVTQKKAIISLLQQFENAEGKQLTGKEADAAYQDLIDKYGEGKILNLPDDVLHKVLKMQLEVEGIDQNIVNLLAAIEKEKASPTDTSGLNLAMLYEDLRRATSAKGRAETRLDQTMAGVEGGKTYKPGGETTGGGGGAKSLSQQLSDQLAEIRKLYAALGKVIDPKTMKAIIAGPFAPEFIKYLADQGEEGRKILEGSRKKFMEEYRKFREIKFTELAIVSRMAPGMRKEELARQRGQARFTRGLIAQGLNQEQVGFVNDQIDPAIIRARDRLQQKKAKGTITDSERQLLRDYNNNIRDAIAQSEKFANISLEEKINNINLGFRETNADLNKTLELMASGIPPEFASELAQVDGASEMGAAQLAVLASQMMEVKTKTEIAKGALVNFSEQLDIVGQTAQTQIETINKLEIEPIQNQIDDLNDSITALEKKKKPHQDAIEALREEEEQLQKVYDDRMKALDEVEAQNRRIADQQRGQMDVASALSRGDIAGAAQAALELQKTMAQQRAEEARNAVQQQFENERAVIAENIKTQEAAIKAIDDQILGVQDAIAAKQKEIEAAKERQLVLEQKLYAIQLMRDMIETKRAQQSAAFEGRTDEAALYGSLLQTQGGLFAGLPFAQTPEGQALMAQFNQGQIPTTPGMPGATLGGMSASASPGTQFNEMMKKELPKVEEAIKAMTGEKGLPTLMGSFVNGLVDSVNQFLSYVANALNATPIVIPPIEIPWTATYNAGKGKTGVVSGVAKTAKTTTNIQKLSSIVLEGQKKAFGGMIAYKGSTEKAPGMMMGGKVKKYAFGSFVPGQGATDKVPAMLTPGEFVVRKPVAQEFRSQLEALNSQVYPSIPTRYRENGIDSLVNIGSAPSFNPLSNYSDASRSIIDTSSFNYETFPVVNNDMSSVTPYVTNLSNNNSSVSNFTPIQYNYNVSVNAKTNANPDEIANAVTRRISQRQQRMIRGTKING